MGRMEGKPNSVASQVKQLGALTTIPVILLAGPAVGFFIGDWIDRKSHLYPWFTILFVFFGLAASGREIVRLLKQIQKDDASGR